MTDALEIRIKTRLWRCRVCDCLVSNPEDHQYHAVIRMTADDEKPDATQHAGSSDGTP